MRTIRGWQLKTGMLVRGPLDGPTTGPRLVLDAPDIDCPGAHESMTVEFIYSCDLKVVKQCIQINMSDHDEQRWDRQRIGYGSSTGAYYGLDRWTVICEPEEDETFVDRVKRAWKK